MADETMGLRCRNCGNTGISPWTGEPCGCQHGKALAHLSTAGLGNAPFVEPVVSAIPPTDPQPGQVWIQPSDKSEPRAIIRHFALAMERKLAVNDGVKGGWRAATKQANMQRWKALQHVKALREEVDELVDALIRMDSLRREANAEQVQNILMEAADVALYALMVSDAVGALPPTDERGR